MLNDKIEKNMNFFFKQANLDEPLRPMLIFKTYNQSNPKHELN